MEVYKEGAWVEGKTYAYASGSWVEGTTYVYINGEWTIEPPVGPDPIAQVTIVVGNMGIEYGYSPSRYGELITDNPYGPWLKEFFADTSGLLAFSLEDSDSDFPRGEIVRIVVEEGSESVEGYAIVALGSTNTLALGDNQEHVTDWLSTRVGNQVTVKVFD